jgi:hypothetical protein
MGMNDWYQRQFGDRGEFALAFALGVDPHPSGGLARDLCWGSVEIWVAGRCLTRSVSDSGVSEGVRWSLLPLFEWLLDVGLRLVNEDPYPRFSKGIDVPDGAAWYDGTLSPPMLGEQAERRWFLRRSEWRHHHALRRAAEDLALPNIVFRRLGDSTEISWDNATWSTSRKDLDFVERRGRKLVPATTFASVVRDAIVEVLAVLAERAGEGRLSELSRRAETLRAGEQDWKWLVHRPTADVIRDEMPDLAKMLDAAARAHCVGLYVPHTPTTQVLRLVRLERPEEVDAVLNASKLLPERPVLAAVQALIRPRAADYERPWHEGNEYAEIVRDAMGWGNDPLPNLAHWMAEQGLAVPEQDLGVPSSVSVLAERTDDARAMVHVNPSGASRMRRETGLATALGHVLLDDCPVAMDGEWEHWPTSARARAFGVALALPEDGVRDLLGSSRRIGKDEVCDLMQHFGSGAFATTYRLKNLRLISRDHAMELAHAVSQASGA